MVLWSVAYPSLLGLLQWFHNLSIVVMGTLPPFSLRWIFTSSKQAWDHSHLCKFIERKKARCGECLEPVGFVHVIALIS